MSEKQTEQMSREEEKHIDHLEDEMDAMDNEDFVYNACCCKDRLISELETRDKIRNIVLPGTMIYDMDDIRKFLMFLSMYPALALVSEVVDEITAHYEESEMQ